MLSNLWCGEGDLNPHEIAPASTSSYSSRSERHDFNDLARQAEPDHVPSYARVGTNTSHDDRMAAKPQTIAERVVPGESRPTTCESAKGHYGTAYSQSIRIRDGGWQLFRGGGETAAFRSASEHSRISSIQPGRNRGES
jgi:hypothetical protein